MENINNENFNLEIYKEEYEVLKTKIIKIVPELIKFCNENFKFYVFYLNFFEYSFGKKDAALSCYIVTDENLDLNEEIEINKEKVYIKGISLVNLENDVNIRTNFLLSVSEGIYDFGSLLEENSRNDFISNLFDKFKNTDLKEFAIFNLKNQYELFKNEEIITDKVRTSVCKFFEIVEFYQTIDFVKPKLDTDQITTAFLILLDNMRKEACNPAFYNFLNNIPMYEMVKVEENSINPEIMYFKRIKEIAEQTLNIICE